MTGIIFVELRRIVHADSQIAYNRLLPHTVTIQ